MYNNINMYSKYMCVKRSNKVIYKYVCIYASVSTKFHIFGVLIFTSTNNILFFQYFLTVVYLIIHLN